MRHAWKRKKGGVLLFHRRLKRARLAAGPVSVPWGGFKAAAILTK
jgi:hypothetical protein